MMMFLNFVFGFFLLPAAFVLFITLIFVLAKFCWRLFGTCLLLSFGPWFILLKATTFREWLQTFKDMWKGELLFW